MRRTSMALNINKIHRALLKDSGAQYGQYVARGQGFRGWHIEEVFLGETPAEALANRSVGECSVCGRYKILIAKDQFGAECCYHCAGK